MLVDESLRHGLDWQATIQLHDLALEVLILELQQLSLALQIEYHLLLGVHLNNRLVLDVHSARRIVQRRDGLVSVRL